MVMSNPHKVSGAKGDQAKEKRLEAALRANLGRRKAQARAVASNNEAQGRAGGTTEESAD